MTVKWNQKELDKKVEDQKKAFLIAAGNVGVNQFASNSPVLTGLLKNSMSYFTSNNDKKGNENSVSSPEQKDTVRIGSGIIYAASVEKRGKSSGWMSRTWDFLVSGKVFENLASKVFKI